MNRHAHTKWTSTHTHAFAERGQSATSIDVDALNITQFTSLRTSVERWGHVRNRAMHLASRATSRQNLCMNTALVHILNTTSIDGTFFRVMALARMRATHRSTNDIRSRCRASLTHGEDVHRDARRATRSLARSRLAWVLTDDVACAREAMASGNVSAIVTESESFALKCAREGMEVMVTRGDDVVKASDGRVVGEIIRVDSVKAMEQAVKIVNEMRSSDVERVVVVDCVSEMVIIPAENLVAAFAFANTAAGENSKLFFIVRDCESARVMFEALEVGVDGVVLRAKDVDEVRKLAALAREPRDGSRDVSLTAATITKVTNIGVGDRVAVDACVNFERGEGMLAGSFASGLFLVHAETVECGYVNTRPFRVNAGPTASYCAASYEDTSHVFKTAYLSELRAGSEILCCDAFGRTRVANVARAKIERRSLVLIEAVSSTGGNLAIVLQNAETCRLVRASGAREAVSVAELAVGDDVLVYRSDVARHAGVAVDTPSCVER